MLINTFPVVCKETFLIFAVSNDVIAVIASRDKTYKINSIKG